MSPRRRALRLSGHLLRARGGQQSCTWPTTKVEAALKSHLKFLEEAGTDLQLLSPRPYDDAPRKPDKIVHWYRVLHNLSPPNVACIPRRSRAWPACRNAWAPTSGRCCPSSSAASRSWALSAVWSIGSGARGDDARRRWATNTGIRCTAGTARHCVHDPRVDLLVLAAFLHPALRQRESVAVVSLPIRGCSRIFRRSRSWFRTAAAPFRIIWAGLWPGAIQPPGQSAGVSANYFENVAKKLRHDTALYAGRWAHCSRS